MIGRVLFCDGRRSSPGHVDHGLPVTGSGAETRTVRNAGGIRRVRLGRFAARPGSALRGRPVSRDYCEGCRLAGVPGQDARALASETRYTPFLPEPRWLEVTR